MCEVGFTKFSYIYVQEADVYTYTPGRRMPGANGYTRKLDFDFKVQCLDNHLH